MVGTLVVSLDFELMWGVRDKRTAAEYGDAILGAREAIPIILDRFQEAGIRATWATVGLLFAKNRLEMLEFAPARRPLYENGKLSPYPDIEAARIGENELEDPLHFGASLVEKIVATRGQEIGTHTYSHYYCMEPGAEVNSFVDDLLSAKAIAEKRGVQLDSIVFPRNQAGKDFLNVLKKLKISAYRGDALGWLYRARSEVEVSRLFRLTRFLDSALPIGGKQIVAPFETFGVTNVPASRFLRPRVNGMGLYHALHVRRIKSEIEFAARSDGSFHLWWHPHNFGRNLNSNLRDLDEIISCFRVCRDQLGMVSKNMSDLIGCRSVGG